MQRTQIFLWSFVAYKCQDHESFKISWDKSIHMHHGDALEEPSWSVKMQQEITVITQHSEKKDTENISWRDHLKQLPFLTLLFQECYANSITATANVSINIKKICKFPAFQYISFLY